MSKVIALHQPAKQQNASGYLTPYDAKANETFVDFLDQVFAGFQKSQRYEYMPFGEKVNVTFKYQCLREFILSLKR